MKKKLFFQLNTARSLLVIINLPIIIVGLIAVGILFKFASDEVSQLNSSITTYTTQISENIFDRIIYTSYLLSDPERYPDIHNFMSEKKSSSPDPIYYLNIKNSLISAVNNQSDLPIQDVIIYSTLNDTAVGMDSRYSFNELYDLYFKQSGRSFEEIKNIFKDSTAQAFYIYPKANFSNSSDTLILCRNIYPYSKNSGFFISIVDMKKVMSQISTLFGHNFSNFGIFTNDNILLYQDSPFEYELNGDENVSFSVKDAAVIFKPSKVLNLKYYYIFKKDNILENIPFITKFFVFIELLAVAFSIFFGGKRASNIDKHIFSISQTNFLLDLNFKESQEYLKGEIISNLINQKQVENIQVLNEKYGINFPHLYYRIMTVRFKSDLSHKEIIEQYPEIPNIISSMLEGQHITCYFSSHFENGCHALINYSDEEILHTNIFNIPYEISAFSDSNIPIFLGLSEKTDNFSNMRTLYENSRSAAVYGLESNVTITYFDDINNSDLAEMYYPYEVERQLHNSIKFGKIDEVSDILEQIHKINYISRKPPYYLLHKLNSLIQVLLYRIIDEMYADNEELHIKYTRDCRNITSTEDPIQNYHFACELAMSIANNFKSAGLCKEIRNTIINFINNNYTNPDLSLTMLSEHTNISYHHLSHIFNDYIGENFIPYLTKCRLEHSKNLLMNSEDKIEVIAKLCGFNESNTFIKTFKKYYGMTPGQYRKNKENIN